jgi:sugar transferase (PEP-CTERM system associated)
VRVAAALATGVALTAVCFFLIPSLEIGRGVLALAVAISIPVTCGARITLARFAGENAFKRRVLVYGAGRNAASIADLRRRSDRRGFVLVGFLLPDGETPAISAPRLLSGTQDLFAVCQRLEVDEVVVAMDDRRRAFPIQELLECRLAGVDVTELATFLERETGRVRLDVLNPSWMIFGSGFRRGPLRTLSSRALDLLASLVILLVSLPVMALTVLAIKLEDGLRAPVFYRQARVGLGGANFNVLKFRSMCPDAEKDGKAQWAQQSDPRITRVGVIIRTLRIDELPQVLNVLKGDMSFVGPRPERPQFVTELAQKIPYYRERHTVKPGITGWAQLCYPYGSSEKDALEKLQYDLYYIKNNDLLFDLAILVQTVEVVFLGKGSR